MRALLSPLQCISMQYSDNCLLISFALQNEVDRIKANLHTKGVSWEESCVYYLKGGCHFKDRSLPLLNGDLPEVPGTTERF